MKKRIKKRRASAALKRKAPFSLQSKLISLALLLFVVGAIAFFVYRHHASAEAQQYHSQPRFPASPKALVLANPSREVVIRS